MKISAEKLQEIIKSHGRWLRNEEGGERANLSDADLSGADLSDAYLSGADLRGAYLDKTYYQVVRIGSRRGTTTYCVDDDNVLCGCWNNYKGGTLEEFKTRVESVYGREDNNPNEQYYDEYMAAITFFAAMKEMK
uniref:Pentapeptide repeat family protein n=1 Tax=Podoviridae sp. ctW0z17 TaxID=2825254 RepID=A0A8S5UXI6_9CAUD|nr:MAG TPA: pentapeptide repeat family protein [Podoviridae sp. ctW0z17]